MKHGKKGHWYPFYVDNWLFGSTRHELIIRNGDSFVDLRAIWVDLLTISKKDDGWIRANETTPYPLEQLAGMFCVPLDLLKQTVRIALEKGKLSEPQRGIYYINSTEIYELSERHERRMSGKTDTMSAKTDTLEKSADTILKREKERKREREREEKTSSRACEDSQASQPESELEKNSSSLSKKTVFDPTVADHEFQHFDLSNDGFENLRKALSITSDELMSRLKRLDQEMTIDEKLIPRYPNRPERWLLRLLQDPTRKYPNANRTGNHGGGRPIRSDAPE